MPRTQCRVFAVKGSPSGSAFTLLELIIAIALIALMAAILFPVFAQAREKARQGACLSNTRQLGMGVSLYIQDYDETLPLGGYIWNGFQSRWYRDVYPYVRNIGVFVCPDKNESLYVPTLNRSTRTPYGPSSGGGYGMNSNLAIFPYNPFGEPDISPPRVRALADIPDTAGTFLLCEGAQCDTNVVNNTNPLTWEKYAQRPTNWQVMMPTEFTRDTVNRYAINNGENTNALRRPVARHSGGLSIVYCDGHARWRGIEPFLGVTAARPKGWPYGDPNNSWDNR